MIPVDENANETPKTTYRSRWGRFSPSMGWKAFWSEIIIVVLGIVIALGAAEIVEEWNWQRKVALAEIKLKVEANRNYRFAVEQVIVGPCIATQLDALQQRLMNSGEVLDPAPVFNDTIFNQFVYRIPSRPYVQSVWQALNSDGTASHMNDWRQQMYAQMYTQKLDLTERTRTKTFVLYARSSMLSVPIPLDQSTRAMLLADLMEQRVHSSFQSRVAIQIMSQMRDLGLTPTAKDIEKFLQESGTLAFCKKQGLPLADWKLELAKEPVQKQL